MRVILQEDIPTLGKRHDIKDVRDGFARNFLFPRNLAKPATIEALGALEARKTREEKEKSEDYQRYKALAERLKNTVLNFKVKIGEKGKKTNGLFAGSLLTEASKASVVQKRSRGFSEGGKRAFGSVTPLKIKEALKKQSIMVEKDWILLEESIKTTGEHKVKIKLPQGMTGEVKVVVEAE